MLLRTRITFMVLASYLLMAGGLAFFGVKSEELSDNRYAEATLNGQEIFWRKLIENTVQRLETVVPVIMSRRDVAEAAARKNIGELTEATGQITEALRTLPAVFLWEVISPEGELLFSSRGSLQDTPLIDAGSLSVIVDTKASLEGGVVQDSESGFIAAVAQPLLKADGSVAAVAAIAADLHPPLQEFKDATGADIFLVDHVGRVTAGTDMSIWSLMSKDDFSIRKRRLETVHAGKRFFSVGVLPLRGMDKQVMGALITVRDSTLSHNQLRHIQNIEIGLVATMLLLVLLWLTYYLRRSFAPLDEAIQVLNALSRGDTSVTLEVDNIKDEIGRIAGSVGVFRDNAVKLDQLEERRERQRRRQELFIRLQMRQLADMLSDEARETVLRDIAEMEALAQAQTKPEDDTERGEIEVLAKAFETMSSRIREQHTNLESLIAERTRDVNILREALKNKEQLTVLRQELDFARELQLSSLPQVFPPFPDRHEFRIHAAMVPAKEVGGDFYDFYLIDRHHLAFVVGDASGKGVPAAMFIAITRSLIKAVAPFSNSPGQCMAFVNNMLAADNPQLLFATVFYAVLDTSTGEVRFCNAGHPPPMILRHNGQIDSFRDVSGVALGVMEDLEYETGSFTLGVGDSVLVYTDGVTEATNDRQRLFEESRLIETLKDLIGVHPEAVIARVNEAVNIFVETAPQFDDITMLALALDHLSVSDGDDESPALSKLQLSGFGASEPIVPVQQEENSVDEVPQAGGESNRIDVTITNDLSELERLATVVDTFVSQRQLPSRLAFNLNLSLDELITNIVSYGFSDSDAHDILISLRIDEGCLITEIIDDANEYDPFAQAPEPDLDLELDDRPIGGLGVYLVKEFMSRTQYERLGDRNVTTLWQNLDQE